MTVILHPRDVHRAVPGWPALADALASARTLPDGRVLITLPDPPPSPRERSSSAPRIGDIVATLLRACGIAAAARRLTRRRAAGCGCRARQTWLNQHEKTILVAGWIVALLLITITLVR